MNVISWWLSAARHLRAWRERQNKKTLSCLSPVYRLAGKPFHDSVDLQDLTTKFSFSDAITAGRASCVRNVCLILAVYTGPAPNRGAAPATPIGEDCCAIEVSGPLCVFGVGRWEVASDLLSSYSHSQCRRYHGSSARRNLPLRAFLLSHVLAADNRVIFRSQLLWNPSSVQERRHVHEPRARPVQVFLPGRLRREALRDRWVSGPLRAGHYAADIQRGCKAVFFSYNTAMFAAFFILLSSQKTFMFLCAIDIRCWGDCLLTASVPRFVLWMYT